MQSIKEMIIELLGNDLAIIEEDIEFDTDLTIYGLDSLNVILLIINIEKKYNITFMDENLSLENFSTIRNIFRIIEGELNNDLLH
ncbi:acyl carrier protein [Enterococcus cecorum]|uniref:acyl carrier protein n=1 Tax=Enterococcus cecorum TaxID=44008 RepID=UPI000DFBDCD9|nr:phosphopantetheine-binding protein [Enterococcus cecorum]STP81994.1 acyl carrier protein [Enterococcus cecorum]